ncbi:uncharacterized protein LOC133960292 [Platichthys flesus]|uniref:uncharacterized protein LOC133960292 n=1 Tax=Platichthys flesus TaxID=8260 RepID=UPI002DB5C7D2|nr:uncharacterized protein LOC133960292 [Platichthys flesus]
MQCKECKFSHPNRDTLLKHYRLCHYRGRFWPLPCLYTDCCCTFKTSGGLKCHLSRVHTQYRKTEVEVTFFCQVCDFKDICAPKKYIAHLRTHLRQHVTVYCPFKDCEFTSTVLSTFSSHISRRHNSYNLNDFRASVTSSTPQPTNPSEPDEEFPPEINVLQHPSEVESSSYVEPADSSTVEHKLASLFLYMQTVLHISKSATQQIISGFTDIVSLSKFTATQSIRDVLKTFPSCTESVIEELTERISDSIYNTNPYLLATSEKGILSTEYRRIKYFKEHFKVIDPVEYLYDRKHQNTFVYVSLFEVLEVLLNRPDVLEKVFFDEDCLPGQYRSFRNGQYYKLNKLLGGQRNCLSLGLYIDDLEVCNPLGTSRKIHKITAVYWVLQNLPAKFRSTLPSIQLVPFELSICLKELISRSYFSPDILNSRISHFPYKHSDKVNRPQRISKASFSKGNYRWEWA